MTDSMYVCYWEDVRNENGEPDEAVRFFIWPRLLAVRFSGMSHLDADKLAPHSFSRRVVENLDT
jgi:hypothetical protein